MIPDVQMKNESLNFIKAFRGKTVTTFGKKVSGIKKGPNF